MKKKQLPLLIFRQTDGNHLTLPVLCHILEISELGGLLDLQTADSLDDMLRRIPADGPCIIAYSFMTPHLPDVWEEIQIVRRTARKDLFLLAGGSHPTGDSEGTLSMGFDVVCAGEGERTLPQIVRDILDNSDAVRGAVYRTDKEADLDASFPISRTISLMSPLEITRGCFWRCRFCQTASHHPRHRSLESVKQYLDELQKRRYLFRINFISPSGFEYGAEKPGRPEMEQIEALLRMAVEAGIRHVEYGIFPSELRPNTIRPELLDLIVRYCANRKVTIGAQSGSDTRLRNLKRGHTTEDIERAASYAREAGFTPILDFIMGYPDETDDERYQALEFARHLNTRYRARSQIHFFIPLAGTPMENQTPSFFSDPFTGLLDQAYCDGIVTNWWKDGMALSRKVVAMLRKD